MKDYRVCLFDWQADALNMLNNMPQELAMMQTARNVLKYLAFGENDEPALFAEIILPEKPHLMTEVRLYQL